MTELLILVGAVLLSGAAGFWFGQSRSSKSAVPQSVAYGAEVMRLRRKVSEIERSRTQIQRDYERVRRQARRAR